MTRQVRSTPRIFKNLRPKIFDRFAKNKKAFIQNVYKAEACLFGHCAGKVGLFIYLHLKWKKGMEGDKFFPLSNKSFLQEYKIDRRRKYDAVWKLEAEGLIQVDSDKKSGKPMRVRLLTKVYG